MSPETAPADVFADGRAASPVTAPALRRRRPRRLTAGVVLPVALGVLAAGFAYEALQSRSAMTEVVVARHALPAGEPLDLSDTRLVSIHLTDRAVLGGMVRPSQLGHGWVTSVPVPAGDPLTTSELEKPSTSPSLGEMSIAVPVQQAVGGRLSPGDFVDVIASNGEGGAYYVAQGLRVVAVAPSPGSGALLGTSNSYYVVIAVGKEAALRVAAAVGAQGTAGTGVELVRSSGERSTSSTFYQAPAGNQQTVSTVVHSLPRVVK